MDEAIVIVPKAQNVAKSHGLQAAEVLLFVCLPKKVCKNRPKVSGEARGNKNPFSGLLACRRKSKHATPPCVSNLIYPFKKKICSNKDH